MRRKGLAGRVLALLGVRSVREQAMLRDQVWSESQTGTFSVPVRRCISCWVESSSFLFVAASVVVLNHLLLLFVAAAVAALNHLIHSL
jgi:hypothetical protein